MRWGCRWVTATKGSERERLLASHLSVVRGPKAQWDSNPKLQSPPFFWVPRGVRWDPFAQRWSDGSASRPVLTLTRPGNIGLSRELRCRFLRTALAQRITLCSELITFPGPVTMTARIALAFLDWLLDHDAQLSRLQTSKATFEASPACLDRGSSFVEALFCDVPIHDLVRARLRRDICSDERVGHEGRANRQQHSKYDSQ